MFRLIEQVYLGLVSCRGLLASMANTSSLTTCISLNNQPWITRPLLYLNPDEYNQRLHYYPFMVNFDRCNGCRNTFDDLYYKICVPNKIEVKHF